MSEISEICSVVEHRPFALPEGQWKYYQEWNDALFFHWEIPAGILKKLIPEGLEIDTFEGKAYVSLVAFTMQKIRPRNLPPVSFISDFHEINLRTYVKQGDKSGVYFISIESSKPLSTFVAKKMSGLPYQNSAISRKRGSYLSSNKLCKFSLRTEFEILGKQEQKNGLDKWLTEKYCLFMEDKGGIYRYDIHHKEWEMKHVKVSTAEIEYRIEQLEINRSADLIHYSEGVKVMAWGRQKI